MPNKDKEAVQGAINNLIGIAEAPATTKNLEPDTKARLENALQTVQACDPVIKWRRWGVITPVVPEGQRHVRLLVIHEVSGMEFITTDFHWDNAKYERDQTLDIKWWTYESEVLKTAPAK